LSWFPVPCCTARPPKIESAADKLPKRRFDVEWYQKQRYKELETRFPEKEITFDCNPKTKNKNVDLALFKGTTGAFLNINLSQAGVQKTAIFKDTKKKWVAFSKTIVRNLEKYKLPRLNISIRYGNKENAFNFGELKTLLKDTLDTSNHSAVCSVALVYEPYLFVSETRY